MGPVSPLTRQTVRHRDGVQGRDEEQGFLRSEQGTDAIEKEGCTVGGRSSPLSAMSGGGGFYGKGPAIVGRKVRGLTLCPHLRIINDVCRMGREQAA